MEASFYTPKKLLRQTQNLVKRYNGYFKCNPMIFGDSAYIVLTFDNGSNYHKFCIMHRISEQAYF